MTLVDVKLDVSVVVGSAMLPIRQLLKLGRGAIIPLEATPDDAVTIYVNAEPVAKGTVETMEERLQVRVTNRLTSRRLRSGAPA